MPLEKVSAFYVISSLSKCKGLRIIYMDTSFRMARGTLEFLEQFFRKEQEVRVTHCGDRSELSLSNGSKFTAMPANPDNMCGMRSHQVILGESLAKDEKFVQEVARPLITANSSPDEEIYKRGIFEYAPFPS